MATSGSDGALVVGGWQLFAHPLLLDQLDRLIATVERERAKDPDRARASASEKVLAALSRLMFTTIPEDPTRPEYRQGGTLGPEAKHWFRAKFGNGRFRLFFRYSLRARIIVYAWVNDETSLRTYGSRSDAYAVFAAMLARGDPPDDFDRLVAAAARETDRLRAAAGRANP